MLDEDLWFEKVETVIREPLLFKSKLNIGEDAYTTLRLKNKLKEALDQSIFTVVGAASASTPLVAATFFAPTGFWAFLGLGTAVTPIGWVIAAGLASGGAYYGIAKFVKKYSEARVSVIPKFINTPMDILAIGLFDLITPLALKVSEIDGEIHEKERRSILNHLVKEWGYDEVFVKSGMVYMETNLDKFDIQQQAELLAKFKKENKDCNYELMSKEVIHFLSDIIKADSKLTAEEEKAICDIENIFYDINKNMFSKSILLTKQLIKKGD